MVDRKVAPETISCTQAEARRTYILPVSVSRMTCPLKGVAGRVAAVQTVVLIAESILSKFSLSFVTSTKSPVTGSGFGLFSPRRGVLSILGLLVAVSVGRTPAGVTRRVGRGSQSVPKPFDPVIGCGRLDQGSQTRLSGLLPHLTMHLP